ncbi:MAG: hypothetical protein ACYC27_09995 [Armatimonadota bacterium]
MNRKIISVIAFMFVIMILHISAVNAATETKPATSPYAKLVAEMDQISKSFAATLGDGWQVNTEYISSLSGWKNRVNGAASTFTNSSLKIDGVPASFRISRTNWEKVSPDNSSIEPDIAFSVANHGFWYYCSGNFGKAYPDEWMLILQKLHSFYKLPVSNNGFVCLLEMHQNEYLDIFSVNTPIMVSPQFVTLPGYTTSNINHYDNLTQFLEITDSTGKQLTVEKYPQDSPRNLEIYVDSRYYMLHPGLDFVIRDPGIYNIRMKYPFGKDSNQIAESQEVSIQIIPTDFITLRFTRLVESNVLQSGGIMPVALEFKLKEGDIKQFSEINISYSASKPPYPQFGYLCGSPGRYMPEDIMRKLQPNGKGSYRMQFDLSAGKWREGISSGGLASPITYFMKPGETWWVSMIVSGKLDGRRYRISSNQLTLKMR